MSTTFRRYAPEQSLLLPPDVREWLPESHLAHHVSDLGVAAAPGLARELGLARTALTRAKL